MNNSNKWSIVKLKDCCTIIMGQSPSSEFYNTNEIGLPFYQGKSEFGVLNPTPKVYCSKPNKIAEKGDILISLRAPVGPTNIAPHQCSIGRGLAAIRGLISDTQFVFYYMRFMENRISQMGTGTTFKAISKSDLEDIPIPLPPLPEQQRIVARIEELFSELDNGIQNLKTAKDQLITYRQAVLKAAFEGKLSEKWRSNQHNLPTTVELVSQIEIETRNYYQQQLIDYKEKRTEKIPKKPIMLKQFNSDKVSNLPKDWIYVDIENICYDIIGGGTPSTKVEKYWSGDIPWISSADIYGLKDIRPRKKISKEAINKSACHLLPKGNVVVVTRVGLGKLAMNNFDLCFSQDSQGLILIKSISIDYILLVLSVFVKSFKTLSQGTTISGVTKRQLSELRIPFCSYAEQNQIVLEIETRLSICDNMETTINQSLLQAKSLRQSILKQAFEGKLI